MFLSNVTAIDMGEARWRVDSTNPFDNSVLFVLTTQEKSGYTVEVTVDKITRTAQATIKNHSLHAQNISITCNDVRSLLGKWDDKIVFTIKLTCSQPRLIGSPRFDVSVHIERPSLFGTFDMGTMSMMLCREGHFDKDRHPVYKGIVYEYLPLWVSEKEYYSFITQEQEVNGYIVSIDVDPTAKTVIARVIHERLESDKEYRATITCTNFLLEELYVMRNSTTCFQAQLESRPPFENPSFTVSIRKCSP